MAAFLVTGNPGAGKTTVAAELVRLGVRAMDTDRIAGWQTSSGEPVGHPERVTQEWLRDHRWAWTRSAMAAVIGAAGEQPLFLCGIAANQGELLDLFARIFLLSLDDTTQLQRLDTPDNAGRGAAERAQIVAGRPGFEAAMKAAGAIVLDARQPAATLARQIVRESLGGDVAPPGGGAGCPADRSHEGQRPR